MSNKSQLLPTISNQGLVPLYYHPDKAVATAILRSLYEGGIRVIEWTDRGENGLKNFEALRQLASDQFPDLYLGAGTIKTKTQALKFMDVGADFIVSPALIPEIAEAALDKDLLYVPGCLTPTEIASAEMLGASLIKIFPAAVVGPTFISSVREVFPAMKFMPTGGIVPQKDLLEPWFNAGVVAVGMGTSLIPKSVIENKQFAALSEMASKVLKHIHEIRK